VAAPDESVREAARRMREADVGTLIVVDDKRNPMGVVTDGDVALRCVAEDRDPDTTRVATVMTAPVLCVYEPTPIEEAIRRMAGIAARRLAVTDDEGHLAGVLALDDVMELPGRGGGGHRAAPAAAPPAARGLKAVEATPPRSIPCAQGDVSRCQATDASSVGAARTAGQFFHTGALV
jgi:hypothetical protein